MRERGVQLIHAHYAIPHSIAAVLAQQMCQECGIRVITTLHGTDITLVGSDPSFYEITKFAIEQSDAVTAVSAFLARASRERFHLERSVEAIPNFIDPDEYSPALRKTELRRLFARDDEALLCHISNFRPVKRIPDVIEVFARVARTRPARLLMIGNGPEVTAAHAQAAALEVAERITWLGAIDAVAEPLACADLFLLPSDGESFGLAVLEAMASGVPGIATDSGGVPEVIDDGRTGFLRAVGDTAGMAEAALELLDDPARHSQMRESARAVAIERFSLSSIVEKYEALYASLSPPCS